MQPIEMPEITLTILLKLLVCWDPGLEYLTETGHVTLQNRWLLFCNFISYKLSGILTFVE